MKVLKLLKGLPEVWPGDCFRDTSAQIGKRMQMQWALEIQQPRQQFSLEVSAMGGLAKEQSLFVGLSFASLLLWWALARSCRIYHANRWQDCEGPEVGFVKARNELILSRSHAAWHRRLCPSSTMRRRSNGDLFQVLILGQWHCQGRRWRASRSRLWCSSS